MHLISDRTGNVPPLVSWAQPLALLLLAAILGYVAWATWRTVHVRRERLLPHQAVNRLVLARACVLVAALVAGGYLGYALSWIGAAEGRRPAVAVPRRRRRRGCSAWSRRCSSSARVASETLTTRSNLSHMTTSAGSSRRRQRSTRVVVAVLLLLGAAAAVAGTAVTGSWLAVTVAGGVAVLLGAVATKITHSELLVSRVEAARGPGRSRRSAFRDLDTRRSAEGVEFAADMQGQIAKRDATVSRLERRLTDTAEELADARRSLTEVQEQLAYAERESTALGERLGDAEERATQAVVRVAELEVEVDLLTAQWESAEAALVAQQIKSA